MATWVGETWRSLLYSKLTFRHSSAFVGVFQKVVQILKAVGELSHNTNSERLIAGAQEAVNTLTCRWPESLTRSTCLTGLSFTARCLSCMLMSIPITKVCLLLWTAQDLSLCFALPHSYHCHRLLLMAQYTQNVSLRFNTRQCTDVTILSTVGNVRISVDLDCLP